MTQSDLDATEIGKGLARGSQEHRQSRRPASLQEADRAQRLHRPHTPEEAHSTDVQGFIQERWVVLLLAASLPILTWCCLQSSKAVFLKPETFATKDSLGKRQS